METYAEENKIEIELNGYGSQEFPYLISNIKDLDNIKKVVTSGNALDNQYFALINDIDYNGEKIEPLSNSVSGMTFNGIFDGRGYKIKNFIIDEEGSENASFFGRCDGVIENLLLDGTISGGFAASFVNTGSGTILNCISNCKLIALEAAGIASNWNGVIDNTVFQGDIDAEKSSGIINSGSATVKNSYSKKYPIGEAPVIENCESITETNFNAILDTLNFNAQQLFYTSDYGKWINQWQYNDEQFVFTNNIISFDGIGSKKNPFIIDSAEKLKTLAFHINAGNNFDGVYFYQTADIDLSEYIWSDIVDDSVEFLGVYNGNGHTISNLNTGNATGGLFKNFNGTILNLRLENCNTSFGCGFAGNIGGASLLLNCYVDGNIGDLTPIYNLINAEQMVNCFVENVIEPSEDELNIGIDNLIINYGVHCGEVFQWITDDKGQIRFGENYKNIYLAQERMYWEGAGVEKDPYLISSLEDFIYLRESVYYNESFWRHWFTQTDDIDFSRVKYWRAISDETSGYSFGANYNGSGYKLLNFKQDETQNPINRTIFGNAYGNIFNVHIVDCEFTGSSNGIISYLISQGGKIFNNVVELSDSENAASMALVYNNSGNISNNLILLPNATTDFKISITSGAYNEIYQTPKSNYNQIISNIDEEVLTTFNETIPKLAVENKRRIIDFNSLNIVDDELNLKNNIGYFSNLGLEFISKMLLSNPILLLSVLFSFIVIIWIIIDFIKNRRGFSLSLIRQIWILCVFYLLFVIAIKSLKNSLISDPLFVIINLVAVAIFIVLGALCVKSGSSIKTLQDKAVFSIKDNYQLIIALVPVIIIVLSNINTPIAYDSDLYYGSFQQAIRNFSFTESGILDSFSIASKPMHGIAMWMTIGEMLEPGTGRGVYIVNLLLLLLAQFSIYMICKKLFPKLSNLVNALVSICFAFSGYVISGATYINPDFYSVVSFAIFLCCILYGYKLFALFWGFMIMCSKPNMIVAYILVGIVYFIYNYLKDRKINIYKWSVYILPATIYLCLYFGSNSLNRAGIPTESKNELFVTLGSRFFQYFMYGFIWIQEILIIVAIIILIKNKKIKLFGSFKSTFIFAMWLACFSQFLIVIIGGETLQLCPRYLAVCAIKNAILFAMALEVIPLKKLKKNIIAVAFSALLFVQCFVTIDPSIILTTKVKYDGLHYLVFPPQKSTGNDLTFYNYEYCKEARDATDILSNLSKEEISNLWSDPRAGYKMALGNSQMYAVYWDTERKCRTYIQNENCVRLNMLGITNGMNTIQKYNSDLYTIILRTDVNYAMKESLSETRISEKFGNITVYYSVMHNE